MENGEICKYVYDFAWGRDHYEVIVKWVKDFYPFATKEIAGDEIKESEWEIFIKAKIDPVDPLFEGVSIRAYFQEGTDPMPFQIGAELCKKVSGKMGFEFSHAFVKYAELKETKTYNTSI